MLVVVKVAKRLVDCEEASTFVISLQSESEAMSEVNAKEDAQVPSKEANDEGTKFARQNFGI